MSEDERFNVAAYSAAYSAESNGILQILEEHDDIDLSSISLYLCAAPERDAQLHELGEASRDQEPENDAERGPPEAKKPWWKK